MAHEASHGWEDAADLFIQQAGRSTIGAAALRRWAALLPGGATLLDLACGPGGPRGDALSRPDLTRYAIDAAPTLLAHYRGRYPGAIVACEPVEHSAFFGRQFDGIAAWGLLFLLPEASQRSLVPRLGSALLPGGRLLFTAPAETGEWDDLTTGRTSVALGYAVYTTLIQAAGLTLTGTGVDEGSNHYYYAVKA